jgi:hypothetical protein
MPKFITPRDVTFFKSIAREVVDVVVQNVIYLYKVNLTDTKVNIYGESLNKTWYPPIQMNALINKEAQSAQYEGFGSDVLQNIEFRLDRFMLEEINVYPEIGDIINFNNEYFEIGNISEVQFAGGQPYNNFSVVCNTFVVSKATLNIEQRIN